MDLNGYHTELATTFVEEDHLGRTHYVLLLVLDAFKSYCTKDSLFEDVINEVSFDYSEPVEIISENQQQVTFSTVDIANAVAETSDLGALK